MLSAKDSRKLCCGWKGLARTRTHHCGSLSPNDREIGRDSSLIPSQRCNQWDHELSGLPPELAERIREEAAENDEIYRRRSANTLDLSRVHYFHSEMVDWAIKQMGNLKGARILDVDIGDGLTSVLMALAGAQVTGIEAFKQWRSLARRLWHNVTMSV